MKTKIITTIISLVFITTALPKHIHISALTGNDTIANGSRESPFQTWDAGFNATNSGDTIVLHDGNYGAITLGLGPTDIFTSETTITAAENSTPIVEKITLGAYGSQYFNQGRTGTFKSNIIFSNLAIIDGFECHGAINTTLLNCKITTLGPWTGNVENMSKTGIKVTGATNFNIINCTITDTAIGISLAGENITVKDSTIYNITHDGIQITGCKNTEIDNNTIYGLDDGVWDSEAQWSRHCDAIHIYIQGAPTPELTTPNDNITISRNLIYDIESGSIQFNIYTAFPEIVNKNITIRDNIFNPVGAVCVNVASTVKNLSIYHNTFTSGVRNFTNPNTPSQRTLECSNSVLRIIESCSNVSVFNNILNDIDSNHPNATIWDYNIITNPTRNRPYPRNTILQKNNQLDPNNPTSPPPSDMQASNNGLLHPILERSIQNDYYGTPRIDLRPDIGCYELPNQSPPAVPLPLPTPNFPTIFYDDFEDNDLQPDPHLNTTDSTGIDWITNNISPTEFYIERDDLTRNAISTPTKEASTSITTNYPAFTITVFSFLARNYYSTQGVGVIIKHKNMLETRVDIGRDTGNISTFDHQTNTTTHKSENSEIRLPHQDYRNYTLRISTKNSGYTIEVDADSNGTFETTYTTTNSPITEIGFYKDSNEVYRKVLFDNITIKTNNILLAPTQLESN